MKGFVFHSTRLSARQEVLDTGRQQPTDAIVGVDTVTTCGTDLHILVRHLTERAYGMPWAGGDRDVRVHIDPLALTGRRTTV
jgi:threonine dehydrogenase-like Zn-dependent dehydrogenase